MTWRSTLHTKSRRKRAQCHADAVVTNYLQQAATCLEWEQANSKALLGRYRQ